MYFIEITFKKTFCNLVQVWKSDS